MYLEYWPAIQEYIVDKLMGRLPIQFRSNDVQRRSSAKWAASATVQGGREWERKKTHEEARGKGRTKSEIREGEQNSETENEKRGVSIAQAVRTSPRF